MSSRPPVRVLFVSRRGGLRAVLAQACLDHPGRGRFRAQACGMPADAAFRVHAAAREALARAGIPLPAAPPGSWDDHLYGPVRHALVIVLDSTVASLQPRWPGQPAQTVWPLPELAPAGLHTATARALGTLHLLRRRLEILANLPMHGVDRLALHRDIDDLVHR